MWLDQYKEVKCNAIGCEPIHNERTNGQLLCVKWKGKIQSAKMKHLPDWFYSGLLLTSQMPHQISASIRKCAEFVCEGIFGSTEYAADSTFCDSGQTTSAPLVPGRRPSIHNTHTQGLDKSGASVGKFGVRDTWGHCIKIPKFDAMNAIKKIGIQCFPGSLVVQDGLKEPPRSPTTPVPVMCLTGR